jgi:hypothetical protein
VSSINVKIMRLDLAPRIQQDITRDITCNFSAALGRSLLQALIV